MKSQLISSACKRILVIFLSLFVVAACKKELSPIQKQDDLALEKSIKLNNSNGHLQQTKTFSSEVVQKWLDMEYRLLLQPQEQNTGIEFILSRFTSALGIAAYESVVPGMPAYQSLSGQLTDMPAMTATVHGAAYHWPACANAALAAISRSFLPNTSASNKALIDSLENALNLLYKEEVDVSTFERSAAFGKSIALQIFNWTNTDGFYTTYPLYVPPVGPGFWVPTPPAFQTARGVHWGDIRLLMPGVLNENFPAPPISYSTNILSGFYTSMRDVYDTKQLLATNPVIKAQANYWRGTPGGSGFILWFAILKKVLAEQGTQAMLDKAALAFCKMGIVQKDGATAVFKAKYFYNQLAPITYIRTVMGFPTWNAEFATQSSPCYPEIHSQQFGGSAAALSLVFGNNYHFNTQGINELPGYSFDSFEQAAIHGGKSRFYAGVGTQAAVDAGIWIGNKTAAFLDNNIKFLKE